MPNAEELLALRITMKRIEYAGQKDATPQDALNSHADINTHAAEKIAPLNMVVVHELLITQCASEHGAPRAQELHITYCCQSYARARWRRCTPRIAIRGL